MLVGAVAQDVGSSQLLDDHIPYAWLVAQAALVLLEIAGNTTSM